MPFLEDGSQRIVVRVVYDGPAMSGKTTNIRELYEIFRARRGSEIANPGQIGERTIFMDWLHVETGLVSGHQLASHFISVPGQKLLARRRELLLSMADAVVFVCSAERNAIAENREAFLSLQDRLLEREDEIPIIVQRNKLDHPEAVSEDILREALEIGPEVRVIGARAHDGVGVRETAGLAVRGAAERVRQLVRSRGYAGLSDSGAGAIEIAEQMRQAERVTAFDRATLNPDALLSGQSTEGEPYRPPRLPAPVPGLPALPSGDSPGGLLWPVDEGRSILRRALGAAPELESHIEVKRLRYDAGAWSFWVDRAARYTSLDVARLALLRAVRKSVHLGSLRFPQMALALAPENDGADASRPSSTGEAEGGAWFLWRVSPGAASIKDTLDYGARARSPEYLAEQLLGYLSGVAAAHELERSIGTDLGLELSPEAFCLVGTRPYYLLEDRTIARTTPLLDALMAPLSELVFPPSVLNQYISAIRETFEAPVARPILEQLSSEIATGEYA